MGKNERERERKGAERYLLNFSKYFVKKKKEEKNERNSVNGNIDRMKAFC